MYVLNLDEDGRILSIWDELDDVDYGDMPKVDTKPDGNVGDYLYINGQYVYEPLPEQPEPEPTEETITADEMAAAIMEGVNEV